MFMDTPFPSLIFQTTIRRSSCGEIATRRTRRIPENPERIKRRDAQGEAKPHKAAKPSRLAAEQRSGKGE
jgi:hypothetical protein